MLDEYTRWLPRRVHRRIDKDAIEGLTNPELRDLVRLMYRGLPQEIRERAEQHLRILFTRDPNMSHSTWKLKQTMDRFCFLSEGEFAGLCLEVGGDVAYNPDDLRFYTNMRPRYERPYQAIAALRSAGMLEE